MDTRARNAYKSALDNMTKFLEQLAKSDKSLAAELQARHQIELDKFNSDPNYNPYGAKIKDGKIMRADDEDDVEVDTAFYGDDEGDEKVFEGLAKGARTLSYDETIRELNDMPMKAVEGMRKGLIEADKQNGEDAFVGGIVAVTPKGKLRFDIEAIRRHLNVPEPVNKSASADVLKAMKKARMHQSSADNTTSKFLNHYRAPASISQYFDTLDAARVEAQKYSARHVGTTHVVFDNDTDEIVHTCIVDKEEMYALH